MVKLTSERLLEMWDDFDADGNGNLDRSELARLLIACYREQIQAIKTQNDMREGILKSIGARYVLPSLSLHALACKRAQLGGAIFKPRRARVET